MQTPQVACWTKICGQQEDATTRRRRVTHARDDQNGRPHAWTGTGGRGGGRWAVDGEVMLPAGWTIRLVGFAPPNDKIGGNVVPSCWQRPGRRRAACSSSNCGAPTSAPDMQRWQLGMSDSAGHISRVCAVTSVIAADITPLRSNILDMVQGCHCSPLSARKQLGDCRRGVLIDSHTCAICS